MSEGSSSYVLQQHRKIAELGTKVDRETSVATEAIYGPLHPDEPPQRTVRDLAYGDNDRHRLDFHLPISPPEALLPIVVFLHGGGFVGGNKGGPGRPMFDNIGRLAVEAGFVGVTMNYRLAPSVSFPAGAEDVALAVRFLASRAAKHGADPGNIILMGHSAGAEHVASFLARPALLGMTRGVVGAVLSSGIYDPRYPPGDTFAMYYGADEEQRAECSSIPGLLTCGVPLLVGVAEFDPPELHLQTARLLAASVETNGYLPGLFFGAGHNHFSAIAHIGTEDRGVSDSIVDFVRMVTHTGQVS